MVSNIEKEFRKIATAFESIQGYTYEYLSVFNSRGKDMTHLLVDKTLTGTRNSKNHKTIYTFNLYFLDNFFDGDRAVGDEYSTKQ